MKTLFKVGEEVVCLKDQGKWIIRNMNERFYARYGDKPPYPKKNEIYTVANCFPVDCLGTVYISLKEIPEDLVFEQTAFASVMPTSRLAAFLDSIFHAVTI